MGEPGSSLCKGHQLLWLPTVVPVCRPVGVSLGTTLYLAVSLPARAQAYHSPQGRLEAGSVLQVTWSSGSHGPPGHAVLWVTRSSGTQSSGSRGPPGHAGHAVLRARPEVQVRTWLVKVRWLRSVPPRAVSPAEEGLGVPKTPSWLPRGHAGDHSQGQEAARLVSLALQQTIRLVHPQTPCCPLSHQDVLDPS